MQDLDVQCIIRMCVLVSCVSVHNEDDRFVNGRRNGNIRNKGNIVQ